jgi:GT2 family glycosyltransferase
MRILSEGLFALRPFPHPEKTTPNRHPLSIPSASIVIPTRGRPAYLEVALASIAPQATAAGAEVVVVDDAGSSPAVRELTERFGARYEPHPGPLGLNVARNTGVARSRGELVVFVDDDVQVAPGWLAALLGAAGGRPDVQVFTGPIRPRLEGRGGWSRYSCGREGPPITALDLGPEDTDGVRYAWGANMAVRRAALERVGPFDVTLRDGGDEQEWQDRLNGDGGVLYVAAAALDHRRTGPDARLRVLARAAHARGRAARRYDARRGRGDIEPTTPRGGRAPSLSRELATLAGCLGHVVRYRCPAGLTMVAHSLGRLRQGVRERAADVFSADGVGEVSGMVRAGAQVGRAGAQVNVGIAPTGGDRAAAGTAPDDFLSGESGTVGGLDAVRRRAEDELVDALELASGRRLRLARAARREPPRRRVLVLCVERPERRVMAGAIRSELARSRHELELRFGPPGAAGKFENLNRLLAAGPSREHSQAEGHGNPIADYDWLLAIDDDVVLPRGFADNLLFLAERFALDLAQPAHCASSHAAWRVTRRQPGAVARETRFVEIGPVTAFARRTFPTLLPFPALRMGWGLDLHWAALAGERGWRRGVLDAVAIRHAAAPAAQAYSREAAVAEARTFLSERPYLSAADAQRTLVTHRRW